MDAKNNAGESARVLTINVGSSSIRFAFFAGGAAPARVLSGQVERIGLPGSALSFKEAGGQPQSKAFPTGPAAAVTGALLDWFPAQAAFGAVAVVAHRVVHGGRSITNQSA